MTPSATARQLWRLNELGVIEIRIRPEPAEPFEREAADGLLRQAIEQGWWPDPPMPRLSKHAKLIGQRLFAEIGGEPDSRLAWKILSIVKGLPQETLNDVIAGGPWRTARERWAQIPPPARAEWLVTWLEQLRDETKGGATDA